MIICNKVLLDGIFSNKCNVTKRRRIIAEQFGEGKRIKYSKDTLGYTLAYRNQ